MAEDLVHLTRSEIFDSIGDKTKARRELEAVTVDETTPAPIVEAYYRIADAFYRQLDDPEALICGVPAALRKRRAGARMSDFTTRRPRSAPWCAGGGDRTPTPASSASESARPAKDQELVFSIDPRAYRSRDPRPRHALGGGGRAPFALCRADRALGAAERSSWTR